MASTGSDKPTRTSLARRLASRGDLTGFMTGLCGEIGADSYMLVAVVSDHDRHDVRIVASNWVYDTIQLIGHGVIAAIAQSSVAAPPGTRPRAVVTGMAPSLPGVLGGEEARLLDVLDHGEIFVLKLNAGRQRLVMLLSSEMPGQIDQDMLMTAQMRCCYALSQAPDLVAEAAQQDPLSDRERECLFWVSEGKTTEEIAVILGVSANTVNSYVANAIQKFAASNRAMAVATAIRSGIL